MATRGCAWRWRCGRARLPDGAGSDARRSRVSRCGFSSSWPARCSTPPSDGLSSCGGRSCPGNKDEASRVLGSERIQRDIPFDEEDRYGPQLEHGLRLGRPHSPAVRTAQPETMFELRALAIFLVKRDVTLNAFTAQDPRGLVLIPGT